MNSPKSSSDSVSADQVATAPPQPEKSSSELLFVQEQAANAKAAFKQTLDEMTHGLREGVSIRQWTAAHPWVMMSSAAVVGFVAGCAAIPSKDETFRKKFDELKAALRREKSDNPEAGEDGHTPHKSFLASVLGDVLRAAIPAMGSILSAAMQQPAAPRDATGNSPGGAPGNNVGA